MITSDWFISLKPMSHPSAPKCYDEERAAAALGPDATQLQVVGHSLAAVASLPRRLIHPPPKQRRLELRDVLAGRHCSPISLADFEHYLAYTEYSVENLYFTLWLQAYTAEYAALEQNPTMAEYLSGSMSSARKTYIQLDAPYELNLTAQNRSEILSLPATPPPPPSAYEDVQREVYMSLMDSLQRWEKKVKSNAGWRRLAFSTCVGLGNACITVGGIILGRIYMRPIPGRILAACIMPWLWFCVVGVMCGLKGICIICYTIGGSVRQVSSFELSLPRVPPSTRSLLLAHPSATSNASSFEAPTSVHNDDADRGNGDGREYHRDYNVFPLHSARVPEFNPATDLKIPKGKAELSKAKIVQFLAPMVAIEDALVLRAYWETVVNGFLWSLLIAVVICAIVAAV
ncbi:hypothetical protein K439DRAFT_685322 [Ramaria rubella]|nr:hypothetical protein K439DRAFT_685322 [Ramaria rubella]